MKRPFSPLVWLCAACAFALSALTICDPFGVYAGYAASLPPGTPPIATVFAAAQDGIYPWSVFAFPDENDVVVPIYRPLTGSVTDDEMRSSVGNEEPFREETTAQEAISPAAEAGTAGEDAAETGGDAAEAADTSNGGASAPASSGGFVTVGAEWFNDALFIGDSHTEGLCDYGGISNATFYYKRGVDVWSVMKKAFVGGTMTIPQALSRQQFGKIYIMLGINEIGCGTTESFAEQYGIIVSQLRELQPDALIYIQSIFHTSQKKSASSIYNNDVINARNAAIAQLADGQHVFFLNCNAVFDDESGALTPTYTGDGVHVKAPYYTMWRDYLLSCGRSGVATPAEPVEGIPASQPAEPTVPTAPAGSGSSGAAQGAPAGSGSETPPPPPAEETPAEDAPAETAPAEESAEEAAEAPTEETASEAAEAPAESEAEPPADDVSGEDAPVSDAVPAGQE